VSVSGSQHKSGSIELPEIGVSFERDRKEKCPRR